MLKPASDRLDYGELLKPPAGYDMVQAVGTTYSLDFDALVGAALALGLSAETDSTQMNDPLYLLNTLKQASERITIFCQAGQILMPRDVSPLYILLEKIVYQVNLKKMPATQRYPSFHPKVWFVKYRNRDKAEHFRLIVLSRNLTFDRSWDVGVTLNGTKGSPFKSENQPMIDFLKYLRSCIHIESDNDIRKRAMIRDMALELSSVFFDANQRPFTGFEFIPSGIPGNDGKRYSLVNTPLFEKNFQELMIMSPFLSTSVIRGFNDCSRDLKNARRLLITRRDALRSLALSDCDQFDIFTMKDQVVEGEMMLSEDKVAQQQQDIHAKLFLWKRYSESELYLGSHNATYSAANGNVEAMLRLISKNRWLNLNKLTQELFGSEAGSPDNPFEKTELPEKNIAQSDEMNKLERSIKQLSYCSPHATAERLDDRYQLTLTFHLPKDTDRTCIRISPLLLRQFIPLQPEMIFNNLSLLHLSEFFIVEAKRAEHEICRVVKIATDGIPAQRERALVTDIIKDTPRFFQYLAFLLGDDYLLSALENHILLKQSGAQTNGTKAMPAIYEKMLKAAVASPEKFTDINYVMDTIDSDGIIPDDFMKLFESFRKAVKLK